MPWGYATPKPNGTTGNAGATPQPVPWSLVYPGACAPSLTGDNDTAATFPVPSALEERFDVVTVRYRDAACGTRGIQGSDIREVVYDHRDALPKGTEPTTCAKDITDRGPIPFTQACEVAEKLIKPRPSAAKE